MKLCKRCGNEFPSQIKVEGKRVNLWGRKYCLECSPLGLHNTRKLNADKRRDTTGYYCTFCGETDPSKFYGHKKTRCSVCHNKDSIKRTTENKLKAIEYLGGRCKECGYDKCKDALDFHHTILNTKDSDFKNKLGWSWDRLKQELDKCVLLCKNCHAEYHSINGYK